MKSIPVEQKFSGLGSDRALSVVVLYDETGRVTKFPTLSDPLLEQCFDDHPDYYPGGYIFDREMGKYVLESPPVLANTLGISETTRIKNYSALFHVVPQYEAGYFIFPFIDKVTLGQSDFMVMPIGDAFNKTLTLLNSYITGIRNSKRAESIGLNYDWDFYYNDLIGKRLGRSILQQDAVIGDFYQLQREIAAVGMVIGLLKDKLDRVDLTGLGDKVLFELQDYLEVYHEIGFDDFLLDLGEHYYESMEVMFTFSRAKQQQVDAFQGKGIRYLNIFKRNHSRFTLTSSLV